MIYKNANRILVCTPSNKAVDEILKRVASQGLLGTDVGLMTRVGSIDYDPEESIMEYSLQIQIKMKLHDIDLHKLLR
jgi:hypothetical protein